MQLQKHRERFDKMESWQNRVASEQNSLIWKREWQDRRKEKTEEEKKKIEKKIE